MEERSVQVRPRVEFKIKRFDPAQTHPWTDELGVTVGPATTILEALTYIKETIDPSLTFRASCRSSICGSCALTVNGMNVMACKTRVLDIGSKLAIEPLRQFPVIRDLVVDIEPFLATLDTIYPQLEPSLSSLLDETAALIGPLEISKIDKAADCILCGCCLSACTVREFSEHFIGPAAFAKAYRFIADPRDTKKDQRIVALQNGGLWDCNRCMSCTEVCPRDVAPEMKIERLKAMAVNARTSSVPRARTGSGTTSKPAGMKKAEGFTDLVVRRGRVSEARLPFAAMGVSALGLYDIAIKLLIKRKLSALRTQRSLKHKEVRALARASSAYGQVSRDVGHPVKNEDLDQ